MTQDEIIRMAREVWGERAVLPFNELERFAAIVATHEREKPVTVPANGLRQQEPSRSSPTGSQSNEIVPVGYVDAMFRFQTCQEHHVSPSDRFKPVYTAEHIKSAVLAEREECAKVCETDELCCKCGDECAAAIRARNN